MKTLLLPYIMFCIFLQSWLKNLKPKGQYLKSRKGRCSRWCRSVSVCCGRSRIASRRWRSPSLPARCLTRSRRSSCTPSPSSPRSLTSLSASAYHSPPLSPRSSPPSLHLLPVPHPLAPICPSRTSSRSSTSAPFFMSSHRTSSSPPWLRARTNGAAASPTATYGMIPWTCSWRTTLTQCLLWRPLPRLALLPQMVSPTMTHSRPVPIMPAYG